MAAPSAGAAKDDPSVVCAYRRGAEVSPRKKVCASVSCGMKLNFGCGFAIKEGPDWVNADIQKAPHVDISFDFDLFPYPFEDDTFEHVLADNVLEHLNHCELAVRELHRVCRNGAEIVVRVPYWNAKCAYNDVGHKHFFNERALDQLFGVDSSYQYHGGPRFERLGMIFVPSNKCRWLPRYVRFILSTYLCNVVRAVEATFRVVK